MKKTSIYIAGKMKGLPFFNFPAFEEAAHLLRVERAVLEEMARRNEVPARRIGPHWRFNRETLMAWVNGDWKLITAGHVDA